MSRAVKIGVIGLGAFGQQHAQTLAGLAEADLCALVDPRLENVDKVRSMLGRDIAAFSDVQTAIRDSDAQAWVVASSTDSHVEITRRLLQAGKIVLLEKPISRSVEEAATLEPLVAPDSANLMIGHILLFNSEFLALRDEAAKRSGIDYILCIRHRGDWHRTHYRGENPVHLTMVHDLYCVQALMNGREPTRIWAQKHVHTDGQVDLAMAQLQFDNGAIASFSANFMVPEGGSPAGYDVMEVFGQGWMARLSPNPRPFQLWDQQRQQFPMTLEIRADGAAATGMLAEQLRCFCRVVKGQQAVPRGATYHDAMQVQRWIQRIVQAAECK